MSSERNTSNYPFLLNGRGVICPCLCRRAAGERLLNRFGPPERRSPAFFTSADRGGVFELTKVTPLFAVPRGGDTIATGGGVSADGQRFL